MRLFSRGPSEGPPSASPQEPHASAASDPRAAAAAERSTGVGGPPELAGEGGGGSLPVGPPPPPGPSSSSSKAAVSKAQRNPFFGDDVDDKISRTGCSREYGALQDCLDETDKLVEKDMLSSSHLVAVPPSAAQRRNLQKLECPSSRTRSEVFLLLAFVSADPKEESSNKRANAQVAEEALRDWRRCQEQLRLFQQCCRSNKVAGA
ncbi:hypothetical protein Efla_005520 [Eimeria flavescens]